MKNAFSLEKVQEWDVIGITRGIHVSCKEEFKQHGSGLHICRPDGSWKTDLSCTIKGTYNNEHYLKYFIIWIIEELINLKNVQ